MSKVRVRRKKFPKDWDVVEETLEALEEKMREAENADGEGKRRNELLWPIFRIHHQRSRYVYEQFYKHRAITRECYEFCLRHGYADKNLIAKWKKRGYERLCCLSCIQPSNHSHGTTCICRVPSSQLDEDIKIECVHCGCRGCSSGD